MEPHHIFLLSWSILVVTMLTVMFLRGKKALAIFPKIETVKILFREKGVSGNSRKSLTTKLGGAQNVLEIIITEEELWVRSPLLFAGFGKTYDLLHKIPLTKIVDAQYKKRNVVVSFITKNNLETTLNLEMKKAQEFVAIINKNSVPQGV